METLRDVRNILADILTDYPVDGSSVFDAAAAWLNTECKGNFLHETGWSEQSILDCIDEGGNIIEDKANRLVDDFIEYVTGKKQGKAGKVWCVVAHYTADGKWHSQPFARCKTESAAYNQARRFSAAMRRNGDECRGFSHDQFNCDDTDGFNTVVTELPWACHLSYNDI